VSYNSEQLLIRDSFVQSTLSQGTVVDSVNEGKIFPWLRQLVKSMMWTP